jgi:hypothetical protein
VTCLIIAPGFLQDLQENNMEKKLAKSISNFVKSSNLDCYEVQTTDAINLIENLAYTFCFDLSKRYLWEGALVKERNSYKNDNTYWEMLSSLLFPNFGNRVYLVITDDDFFPWPVFDCKKEAVADILKVHQYFEFFIFDKSMQKILFDIHDNEILLITR